MCYVALVLRANVRALVQIRDNAHVRSKCTCAFEFDTRVRRDDFPSVSCALFFKGTGAGSWVGSTQGKQLRVELFYRYK